MIKNIKCATRETFDKKDLKSSNMKVYHFKKNILIQVMISLHKTELVRFYGFVRIKSVRPGGPDCAHETLPFHTVV